MKPIALHAYTIHSQRHSAIRAAESAHGWMRSALENTARRSAEDKFEPSAYLEVARHASDAAVALANVNRLNEEMSRVYDLLLATGESLPEGVSLLELPTLKQD